MANHDIFYRMNTILDAVARSEMLASDAERELGHCMSAIECVEHRHIHASRDLSYRLVTAFLSDGPNDELFPNESLDDVIRDYREFISLLPN